MAALVLKNSAIELWTSPLRSHQSIDDVTGQTPASAASSNLRTASIDKMLSVLEENQKNGKKKKKKKKRPCQQCVATMAS